MERVFSIDDMPWADLKGLPGARGFEFKALTDDAYTKAYSCELVRLDPGDHSVPHTEPWSHLLYILSGTGDVTIDGNTTPIRSCTVCQVRAGEKHSCVILVTITCSSWLSTIRHASESRMKLLRLSLLRG